MEPRTTQHPSHRAHRRSGARVFDRVLIIWLLALVAGGCRQNAAPANRLPPVVAEIEEAAEDIFDLTTVSNWERAEQRAQLLREATARLEAERGHSLPDLERAVSDLDRAIETRDLLRAGHAANEVMRQSVHLGTGHMRQDSAAVLMLDVETREILVNVDTDPQAADAAVSRARELWTGLRPEVERRGEHTLAARCNDHLRQLEAGSAAVRRSEAEALLETIDQLEEIFS